MEVPANYKTAGILILVSGILNLMIALGLSMVFALYGVVSYGICCVCCVLPIAQAAFGVIEVVSGGQMMNGKALHNASTVAIIGIVVGAMLGGGLTMVLEIVALVLLQDKGVKGWLESEERLILE